MGASFDFRIYETDDKREVESLWYEDVTTVEEEYPHDYISDNFDEDDEDFDYDEAMEEAIDDLGYSGQINTLDGDIEWANVNPFSTIDEATGYIEKHHEKWNSPIAVPFKSGNNIHYAVGGWCSD